MDLQQLKTQAKQHVQIFIYIKPEFQKELMDNAALLAGLRTDVDKMAHGKALYVLLNIDAHGVPTNVRKTYIDGIEHTPMEDNKNVNHMRLVPFILQKDQFGIQHFFKCDNCRQTGQHKGYVLRPKPDFSYTFCLSCTHGH